MKEQQRQALSALLDGELPVYRTGGVLDALEQDPELRALWERYHLIGGALRGERVAAAYRDIADRTGARISKEPWVLAPAAMRPRHPSRLAPFAGVALAASAAFLAVFAVPSLFEPGTAPAKAPATAQAGGPPSGPQSQAAAAQHLLVSRPSQRWYIDQPPVENALDRLLVSHQEYAPATGINGMLPYATLVSYGSGR